MTPIRLIQLSLLIFVLAACNSNEDNVSSRVPSQADVSVEPGAHPTAEFSMSLLSWSPAERLTTFRDMLVQERKTCRKVTSATLKGGFEGTDLWQIICDDSGEWLIEVTTIWTWESTRCADEPKICDGAWDSVRRAS
jgi:hypothetical protein